MERESARQDLRLRINYCVAISGAPQCDHNNVNECWQSSRLDGPSVRQAPELAEEFPTMERVQLSREVESKLWINLGDVVNILHARQGGLLKRCQLPTPAGIADAIETLIRLLEEIDGDAGADDGVAELA